MLINNQQNPSAESGFATILTVLLVGLAIAASALGTAYYVNSSQKSLVTSHALTNTEAGAWTGAETFRKYLDNLDETDISDLDGQSLALKISDTRNIELNDISVEEVVTGGHEYYVTVNIQNISFKAKASSTLKVVYEVSFAQGTSVGGSNPGNTVSFPNAMNFYGDLDAHGGVTFMNSTEKATINVAGNFKTGTGLTGIKELNVIGDVNISGGGGKGDVIDKIYSNGDVTLMGGGDYSQVSAGGKVSTNGGVNVRDVYANGDVELGGKGPTNSISTLANITISTGSSGDVNVARAGEMITLKNGTLTNAYANADIDYRVWNSIDIAQSGGTFNCVSNDWTRYEKISAVAFNNCPDNAVNLETFSEGTKVVNPLQGALVEVSLASKPIVNALNYEENANYVFSIDDRGNIKVYVRQVSGISEGSYYIGKVRINNNNFWGSLCAQINSNGLCTSEVVGHFGRAGSDKEMVTYRNGEWLLDDENQNQVFSVASGVLLFKGSVRLRRGRYANTILATGDIDYGESIILKAPNQDDASTVCGSEYFPMPTNLCTEDKRLSFASIGNIALLSGSCTVTDSVESCSENYTGGNIIFKNQATVEGNVIAGNRLDTSGSALIKGPVLAAALSPDGKNETKLGNKTVIDFDGLTDEATIITLPGSDDDSGGGTTITQRVKIKWARYL